MDRGAGLDFSTVIIVYRVGFNIFDLCIDIP